MSKNLQGVFIREYCNYHIQIINFAVNPSPPSANPYSSTQKDGIYIHRTNKRGWAGGIVSTGCLLIDANHWDSFSAQIGNNGFKLRLIRK